MRESDTQPSDQIGSQIAAKNTSSPRVRQLVTVLPLIVLVMAVGVNLWMLRGETIAAHNLNDSGLHASMVRWADHRIQSNTTPLDGWYPSLGLGFAQFHQYQSLPHILTGFAATVIGSEPAYRWSLYLLLGLWPVSVFWGARLLGWERLPAAAAAVVSPLIVSTTNYGYEYGSYVWRGYGLWAQLWAMWLLPPALGLCWQAITTGRRYSRAALLLALVFACHFITGYLAVLVVAPWALLHWSDIRGRAMRAAIVIAGTLGAIAWILVPVLQDAKWASYGNYPRGTFWYDSYGARKVLGWLVTGRLFDQGRPPVLTILVAIGFVVCVIRCRTDQRARALLALAGMSLLLFFGRPTLGPLLNALPGHNDLFFPRFLIGVHLAGILFAGVGIATIGPWAYGRLQALVIGPIRLSPRLAAAVIVVAVIAVLTPMWRERASFEATGAGWMRDQHAADASDGRDVGALIEEAKSLGGGRIYAGTTTNWGRDYRISSVPVYAELLNHDADSVGYIWRVASLSTGIEPSFEETKIADYQLFGVRYVLLPSDRSPAVPARMLDRRGRHVLWQVGASSYVGLVDTTGPIPANNSTLPEQMRPFLTNPSPTQAPAVAFAGDRSVRATKTAGRRAGSPGTVEQEYDFAAEGRFTAQVFATRQTAAVLRSSFHGRWQVTVDGASARKYLVGPSFVGVTIPPGRHWLAFRYVPYPEYPPLIALGAVSLIGLAVGPPLRRRARSQGGRHTPRHAARRRPEQPKALEAPI